MLTVVRHILDFVLGSVLSALLFVLVLILTWQVVSRYGLNDPSTFTEEALRFGVIWLSLLGAAYTVGKSKHMSIDLLVELASSRLKKILQMLVPIAFVLFASVVLFNGGMRGMVIASSQVSPVLQIPMPWIYASLPTSGILMIAYSIINFFELLLHNDPSPPKKCEFDANVPE
ncbi:TRAP transporter small permease [Pseudovibrio exalbescens]|uniref:TRAP transporter small permease n=1 Tax=Pseudovibrio exalbescens TaxID=197461 RepID=UPI000C9A993C|nr:TRAP transporter small permease [Pseudovibrio exalbescens]